MTDAKPTKKMQSFATCEVCAKQGSLSEIRMCGGCSGPFYCSVECQRQHWKAGHKQQCADELFRVNYKWLGRMRRAVATLTPEAKRHCANIFTRHPGEAIWIRYVGPSKLELDRDNFRRAVAFALELLDTSGRKMIDFALVSTKTALPVGHEESVFTVGEHYSVYGYSDKSPSFTAMQNKTAFELSIGQIMGPDNPRKENLTDPPERMVKWIAASQENKNVIIWCQSHAERKGPDIATAAVMVKRAQAPQAVMEVSQCGVQQKKKRKPKKKKKK
jgi:hypothetical protein